MAATVYGVQLSAASENASQIASACHRSGLAASWEEPSGKPASVFLEVINVEYICSPLL